MLMAEDEMRCLISFILAGQGAAPVAWADNEFLLDLPARDPVTAIAEVKALLKSDPEIRDLVRHLELKAADAW